MIIDNESMNNQDNLLTVIEHNFIGYSYDYVNENMHIHTGIPNTKKWHELNNYPFRGTVHSIKEEYVFQAIAQTRENITIEDIREKHRDFRSQNFFGNIFNTDKPLYGWKYKSTVIFHTSAYEESTHRRNISMFQILAKAFKSDHNMIQIHSTIKDSHPNTRSGCHPFARNYSSLLIIRPI
jgi:hypothetical protein